MASQEPRRRGLLIGGCVAAVVLLVGALLSFRHGGGSEGHATQARRVYPTPTLPAGKAGPSGERAGVPVGFSHDKRGAIAAGVAYATASQRWLYFTDRQIRRAIRQITTRVGGVRIADDVVAEVGTARKQLGASPGRVWWLVRPLAWDIESYEPGRARVSVWVVTVLSAVEVAAPQTEWMTVTLDLVWVGADWRVDVVRDSPGPTPTTGPRDQPWDAEPFDKALDGFTRLDGEPVK